MGEKLGSLAIGLTRARQSGGREEGGSSVRQSCSIALHLGGRAQKEERDRGSQAAAMWKEEQSGVVVPPGRSRREEEEHLQDGLTVDSNVRTRPSDPCIK